LQNTKIMATDILGKALIDYQQGNYSEDIVTYSSFDEEDVIRLPYLFRKFKEMPAIEQKALALCNGSVLDIGCGAGSHSLYLQQKGIDVYSLDISEGAIACCEARGIEKTICTDISAFSENTYDTLLLLMNGIGLARTLSNLPDFLQHLISLLKPNGQIILDSSDLIYMFDKDDDGGYLIPATASYYGEVNFTMQYKKQKGEPFSWLFVDFNTLSDVAQQLNFSCELICAGEHYDYLARLMPVSP